MHSVLILVPCPVSSLCHLLCAILTRCHLYCCGQRADAYNWNLELRTFKYSKRVLRNRVCPSFHRAVHGVLSWNFCSGIGSLAFSKFWYDTRTPYKVVHARFFGKTFFTSPPLKKIGKWAKNRSKIGFFEFFPRLCSVVKIYIICCVSVQIFYLGKMLFLGYIPKCSQSIRLWDF